VNGFHHFQLEWAHTSWKKRDFMIPFNSMIIRVDIAVASHVTCQTVPQNGMIDSCVEFKSHGPTWYPVIKWNFCDSHASI
jgi:hypothetical protein